MLPGDLEPFRHCIAAEQPVDLLQVAQLVAHIVLGEVDLPVSPAGATVVLALAAWNTGDLSWGAMLANANQATRAGIVAFVQPTTVPSDLSARLLYSPAETATTLARPHGALPRSST